MMKLPNNLELWYERTRATDDVWRAVFVERKEATGKQNTQNNLPRDSRHVGGSRRYGVTALVLMCMTVTAFALQSPQTRAYFNDIEHSLGNVLDAGLLDFDVVAKDYAGGITPGPGGEMTVDPEVTVPGESFGLEYSVKAVMVDGSSAVFCNAINAFSAGPLAVDKPLLAIDEGPLTTTGMWTLALSMLDPAPEGVEDGMICDVDLLYTGRIDGLSAVQGYTDEEIVHLHMTANLLIEAARFTAPLQILSVDENTTTDEEVLDEEVQDDVKGDVPEEEQQPGEESSAEEVVEAEQTETEGEEEVLEEEVPQGEEDAAVEEEIVGEEQSEEGPAVIIENEETVETHEEVVEDTGGNSAVPEEEEEEEVVVTE